MRRLSLVIALLLLPVLAAAQGWPAYGGDAGGRRYSAAGVITRDNVHLLAPAWTFHTGEQPRPKPPGASFEDTPILADGRLLVCTPSDRVIALDPLTGRQEWAFDPKLPAQSRAEGFSRGASTSSYLPVGLTGRSRHCGLMLWKISVETKTSADPRPAFRLRIDDTVIADKLTAAQAEFLVGEILDRDSVDAKMAGTGFSPHLEGHRRAGQRGSGPPRLRGAFSRYDA